MTLSPATLATLEELKKADWFARVGQDVVDSGKIAVPVIVVPSWEKAMEYCSREDWSFTLNEFANIYRETLAKASPEQFGSWNDRVRLVKQVSVPLVKTKIEKVQQEHDLPSIFANKMQGMIAMVLLEAEYATVVPPGNHAKLAFWLVNGHFPCGWKGEFPNGNLIIY